MNIVFENSQLTAMAFDLESKVVFGRPFCFDVSPIYANMGSFCLFSKNLFGDNHSISHNFSIETHCLIHYQTI